MILSWKTSNKNTLKSVALLFDENKKKQIHLMDVQLNEEVIVVV